MMAGYEPNFSSPTVFKVSMSNDTRCISSGLSILSSSHPQFGHFPTLRFC
nr:MAG TPA: hypothetical protein [Caudoviricetes sp.]